MKKTTITKRGRAFILHETCGLGSRQIAQMVGLRPSFVRVLLKQDKIAQDIIDEVSVEMAINKQSESRLLEEARGMLG